ncbi:DUF3592 domain-containing protein [Butyrivibrio sp. LC3010]|uniref:DUF3592 domain-containing protein n=1 Tax=Butyrivibrio sp. LC3010 TaxID=1280680 RepID=UPI00041B3F52|nr:DUF3592 domain-containing protein [Butyrivibrio sp. LC3010]
MVGIALIILGVVFLFAGLYHVFIKTPRTRAQFERRTAKTSGTISDVIVKTHRTKKRNRPGYNETHTYKISCNYTVNGKDYILHNIPAVSQPTVGDGVDISYNPEEPDDAHVDQYTADPDANKKGGLIILGCSVVMIVLGAIIQFVK